VPFGPVGEVLLLDSAPEPSEGDGCAGEGGV
jgi:hypothetical protein